MGIPYIFGHFTKKYSHSHNIIQKNLTQCDRLFLDYNSIIHTQSQSVLKENSNWDLVGDELEEKIFRAVVDHTVYLTQVCQPKHLLYIAVDGIAPLAKQNQQRRRRYLSTFRNSEIAGIKQHLNLTKGNSGFDSNAISPGTQFMKNLDAFLKLYFEKHHFKFNVEISGHDCAGEGEHKIINLIKNSDLDKFIDVIYGLDADLIMLSLSYKKNSNLYLMRETSFFSSTMATDENKTHQELFSYLKIENLKKSILCELSGADSEHLSRLKIQDTQGKDEASHLFYLYDYIFICIWIGNDFIPGISYLKIKNSAIEVLCEKYRKIHHEIKDHFIYQDSTGMFQINKSFLERFLISLGEVEDSMMVSVTRNYYQMKNDNRPESLHGEALASSLIAKLENYPITNRFPRLIDPEHDPQWRDHYYKTLFGENSQETVKYVCVNWLQGLIWTTNYYFNRKFKFEWIYKWDYAPCITDLTNYSITISHETFDKMQRELRVQDIQDKFGEWNSELQLMMVLPPQSQNLIRPELRSLFNDLKMNCVHYYPYKFKINTYLKRFLWECIPILPNIDVDNLKKSYLLKLKEIE